MIGQTLGHYRIVEQIGAGGMGVVYRAKDERLDRAVALKVLPPGTLADETARKRFRQEALALSKVNHPNIATVYDFDTQAGVDFLVMEYVAGTTLAEKVAGGAMSAKEVTGLGAQVAAALEEAHERGVVHRDLKPGNILVTPKDRVKVLDFGLARLVRPMGQAPVESLTESHATVGTVPYMAPEQLRNEATDARTDIYTAGTVLYEMATGQRPFPEMQVPRLIDAILHQAPLPPSTLNRHVSPALESIILKCLDKEPDRRYQSAKELRVDLDRLSAPAPLAAPAHRPVLPRRWALAGGGALVVLLVVLLGLNVSNLRDRLFGRAGTSTIRSLAVLPLANLSGDKEQDYFADGMTDTLISDLAKISALRVISRTSVMQYKDTKKPLPEIARELNVDAVLEGSVLRAGDRVRITAQLIGASPERHLWAKSYEGDLRDVLALHTQVARANAEEIRITLTPQEKVALASPRAVNPAAHEAYLKGRYHLNKASSQQEIGVAIAEFQRALAKDPTYALAYAGLSDANYALADTYLAPAEVMPKARAAAIKALELDETLAEAHVSLANVHLWYDWDWQRVEKELRRAIELNPNSAAAYDVQGNNLLALGHYPEAVAALKRALVLDPLSLSIYVDAGWIYFQGREYDQAIELFRKGLELEPNYPLAQAELALAYAGKGQSSQAMAAARKGRQIAQIADSPMVWAMLSQVYAVSGERAEAEKLLKELVELSKHRYVCPYEVATAYIALGNKEEAFQWLEKAYRARSACMPFLKTEPRFDPIRADARFQDLLRRVGFPP